MKRTANTAEKAVTRKYNWRLFFCVVAILVFGAGGLLRILARPSTYMLIADGGAEWIRNDDDPWLGLGRSGELTAWFRTALNVKSTPKPAIFHLQSFRSAEIFVNGKSVFTTSPEFDEWKKTYRVDLSPYLTPGVNVLTVKATNFHAPPCLIAYSEALGVRSGPSWHASVDGKTWAPARSASYPRLPDVAMELPPVAVLFVAGLPFFAVVFGATLIAYAMLRRPAYADMLTPARALALVLAAIVVMFVNNLLRIPSDHGFDVQGHYEYTEYILTNWRLPLANDGWTMFQAPLFYLLSVPVVGISQFFGDFELSLTALRVLPMLCGVFMIVISYGILRIVFPDRPDLQIAGLTFSGLFPTNIYSSQFMGNETLCACLSGFSILLALEAIHAEKSLTFNRLCLAGVVYGLALLAKVSALVLGPPLALMYGYALLRSNTAPSERVRRAAMIYGTLFGVALLVSGWWFFRNWVTVGRPFFGGWEPERGFAWWQAPGYRTPRQFFAFGEAMRYPLYSSLWSFWDGLYSTFWTDALLSGVVRVDDAPGWNFRKLIPGLWLAVIPTSMIIAGGMRAVIRTHDSTRNGLLFAVLIVGLFIAAAMTLFLTVPFLSCVKASHMLSAMPCYVLLFVNGYDLVSRNRYVRPVIIGLLACWGMSVYTGFFSL